MLRPQQRTEGGRTSQHTVSGGQHVRLQGFPREDGDRRVQPEHLHRGPCVARSASRIAGCCTLPQHDGCLAGLEQATSGTALALVFFIVGGIQVLLREIILP